jgi:hypothetical protein
LELKKYCRGNKIITIIPIYIYCLENMLCGVCVSS